MVDRLQISEVPHRPTASILARRGASAIAIGDAIGLDMPVVPRWVAGPGINASSTAPGTWLAFGEEPGWCAVLAERLDGLANVVDQTGAYRIFHVEGPDARTLLQRGAYIDLDGPAFPAGALAVTVIGHIDVIIRCLVQEVSYEVAVYRSYAESFLRWADAGIVALLGDAAATATGADA